MKLRFIHAADLHLDTPFKGLTELPVVLRRKLSRSTFQAFERLIDLALREQVDFLLLAGDIYDRSKRSLKAQLAFKQALERLSQAGIASFIVHGNHDPLDGEHIPIDWPPLVHFFSSEKVERVPFYKDGQEVASIYGFSYPTAHFTTNIARAFQRESDAFSIGLLHTNCGGVAGHGHYAPCSKQDLLQADMDYWALGHVHRRQVLHHEPPIVYPGNLQGRHRLESGEKGCYLVEVSPWDKIELTFVPVQEVLWLEEEIVLTGLENFQEVLDAIEEAVTKLIVTYQTDLIISLNLVGETVLWDKLSQEDVLEDLVMSWRNQKREQDRIVWVESIQFVGEMSYEREQLRSGEGVYADLIHLVDEWLSSPDKLGELDELVWSPLFNHARAKRLLSPFSMEERVQLLKQAEHLLLAELIKGERE